MLEVRNLVKKYKISKKSKTQTVTALNNVSITFPEKGLIFLLGKSGSGKSTLLNAIGGLDTFDSGEIIIKGKSSKEFTQSDFDSYRNTFIGFIFQEYNVLEEFSVAKNLSLAIELQGKPASKDQVDQLLEMVEMTEYAKRKPNQLSGGQKQRVAIARALIKNPEIIMADEPTGALDSNTGKQVMETLKKLSEEKLVIIVSHDREFAEIYGDRIIELKDGKIIRDVTKKEVEPVKTESGISIIDDDVIHIKKGQKFTQEDINTICKKIMANSEHGDTIISLSEKANKEVKKATSITDDGNREVFKETTEEDVNVEDYSKQNFKLIKSKLKFKDSFKMGASALKNKVGKLVFTILLSFVAFGMFGIIDTLSSFNRPHAVYSTIEEFDQKYISIMKESEGEYSNTAELFTNKDVQTLTEKFPSIKLKKVVGKDIRFGSSYYNSYDNRIRFQTLDCDTNLSIKAPTYSGMIYLTQDELNSLGLDLIAGRLPQSDNEICITKYQYECIKNLNEEKVTKYSDILDTYKTCYINNDYIDRIIVGIIDDGKDMTKYYEATTEQLNTNMMYSSQLSREIEFGFTNILLITENRYNQLLDVEADVQFEIDVNNSTWGLSSKEFYYGDIKTSAYKEMFFENNINAFNDRVFYIGGEAFNYDRLFLELEDDEILVNYNQLSSFGSTEEEIQNAIKNNSIKIYLRNGYYDYNEYKYIYTNTQEMKVAGYIKDLSSSYLIMNESAVESMSALGINSYSFSSSDEDSGYEAHYFYSLKNYYFNHYGHSYNGSITTWIESGLGNVYIKNNQPFYDGNNFYELKKNEIIMPEYYFQSVGSGQELYDKIDEGLEVKIYFGSRNRVIANLQVVGVFSYSYNAKFISEETYNEAFGSRLKGFDYAIALLSDDRKQNQDFIEYCEKFDKDGIKFTVQNGSTPILDQFGDIFKTISEVFLYVGIVFAVFSAFLLMNFISTSISYKRREIGILRALGARGSDVFGIFFNESLVIALINFALAAITTIVTCTVLNNLIITELGLNLVLLSVGVRQIGLMLGISILSAFLASLLPVIKISRKKPIDAINNR